MEETREKAAAGTLTVLRDIAIAFCTLWAVVLVFTIPLKVALRTIQFLWNLVP